MMFRMLIVEDEIFSQQALKCSVESLYPQTFEILLSDNGLDALNICQHQDPDLVLVDLNIPGISGLSLIRTLNDYHFNGKIVIITAYNRSKYIREALSLGVVNYLLKPVDFSELKETLEKCVGMLQEKREEKKAKESSLFSYAQSYLIRDILNGSAPQKILSEVYGFGKEGELRTGMLCWYPVPKANAELKARFIGQVTELFSADFSMIYAEIQNCIILFLHAAAELERTQVSVMLWVYLDILRKYYPQGALILGEFCDTYDTLYQSTARCLFRLENETDVFMNENLSASKIWAEDDRIRLRQKFVQRLGEKQTDQLVQYLRRKYEQTDTPWAWISLLLEAVVCCDPSADLRELLTIFRSQNRFALLAGWLEKFYCGQQKRVSDGSLPKSEQAILYIQQNYSRQITQEEVAREFGLTPTYFSSIFKKETGETFPQFLSSYRIKQAVKMIAQGEYRVNCIAESCGFYNKKYFLEIFKKQLGCPFTQYVLEQKEKEEKGEKP